MSQKFRLRVESYIAKTKRVLEEIQLKKPFQPIDERIVKELIGHVRRYVEDADFYLKSNDLETALASISYCEGLLDALKLLGMAEFKWPTGQNKR